MNEPRPLGFSIYAVTDPGLCGADLLGAVREAVEGGAGAVQFRDKSAPTRELLEMAWALRRLTRELGAALFINDRLDIALAVDADGLHLGQEDLPAPVARSLWPAPKWLGISAPDVDSARVAESQGADYVGAGPVFISGTKVDSRPPLGPEGLGSIVQAVRIPVVGIGGITPQNAAEVARSGASAAAVVAGIFSDPRGPRAGAHALAEAFEAGASRRIHAEKAWR